MTKIQINRFMNLITQNKSLENGYICRKYKTCVENMVYSQGQIYSSDNTVYHLGLFKTLSKESQ